MLIAAASLAIFTSAASAASVTITKSYSYGTTSNSNLRSYNSPSTNYSLPSYGRHNTNRGLPSYGRPSTSVRQPTVNVNIYQQPSYSRPSYAAPRTYGRPVIIHSQTRQDPPKTKDLAKGAAVVLGVHCLLGGCY